MASVIHTKTLQCKNIHDDSLEKFAALLVHLWEVTKLPKTSNKHILSQKNAQILDLVSSTDYNFAQKQTGQKIELY